SIVKKQKKCHGNLKEQRIRRRKLKQTSNNQRVEDSNHENCNVLNLQLNSSNIEANTANDNRSWFITTAEVSTTYDGNITKKRKKLPIQQGTITTATRTLSEISISEPSKKKQKKDKRKLRTTNKQNDHLFGKIYKKSKYLKVKSFVLVRTLRLHLKHLLQTSNERKFVLTRLKLLDEQYCVTLWQDLWQFYFDFGIKHSIWPESVTLKVKIRNGDQIKSLIMNYLHEIENNLQQCHEKLTSQMFRRPSTLSFETIDSSLKEFVYLHQKRFTKKINCQKVKLTAKLHDNQLWQQLSSYQMTIEQLEGIERLISIQHEQMQIYEELLMLEQRILCRFLSKSFDDISTHQINSIENNNNSDLIMKERKLQQIKRNMLNDCIHSYEQKILLIEQQYQQELTTFENISSINNTQDYKMSLMISLKAFLENRIFEMKHSCRFKMTLFRSKLFRRRSRLLSTKNKITDVYPQTIIDVSNLPFNDEELSYISRTGSFYKNAKIYIRPNQSALRPYPQRLLRVQQDHDYLMKQIVHYLSGYCYIPSNANVIKQLSNQLKDRLTFRHMSAIPIFDDIRAHRELHPVQTIRRKLKKAKLVLRPTDKSGVFHIGSLSDYERKIAEYQTKTRAYIELSENPLSDILNKVTHLLNELLSKKQITVKKHYGKMMPDRNKVELSHMYYLPKVHKPATPLRPIMNTMKAPTTGISRFLDQLIRPLFYKHVRSTTIFDGSDLIHRLIDYVARGRLKSSTLFCTFDIIDLYTMLPQEESLNVLCEFLIEHGYKKIDGIPIDAIRRLARLVLTENVFVDGSKIYRQILGGAMGSPFTLTLANIFMWKWEKNLLSQLSDAIEIYGRYIDDVFFTTNKTKQEIEQLLQHANNYHPNIKLNSSIGFNATFLDVYIENKQGMLITSVHHKESAEPYITPFKSDHPRHTFANIIQGQITRAARYCSSFEEFDKERRNIRLTLLYNG
ncbi:unnamed protein product, partial [Rotaria sp. Silwood2]